MASKISKPQIRALYRSLLRESEKFSNYNFRAYAIRRVRDGFREKKDLTDPKAINNEIKYAMDSLQLIRRQIVIGDMYRTDKLVIENMNQ
ncbi:LYR motif-containing protein 4 [Colias croceus]|uniref:LYR motif-containing protein 4 n=1 Tax=Colias crocea TaxID=72248 RepID=UPI001E2804EA|nr:LYR motif-containing protein 4 [Colias croceus]